MSGREQASGIKEQLTGLIAMSYPTAGGEALSRRPHPNSGALARGAHSPYNACMKKIDLGAPLFSRSFVVSKHLEALPDEARQAARQIREDMPSIDRPRLKSLLESDFGLQPLRLGKLQRLTLDLEESRYQSIYGIKSFGYVAEVSLPYSGSARLWKQRLHNSFVFPIHGKVGTRQTRFRMIMDVKDFDAAEKYFQNALADLRRALLEFEPTVAEFSEMVGQRLDECVAAQTNLKD